MAFSSALQITGLDDFITPSQACVNPAVIEKQKKAAKRARLEIDNDLDGLLSIDDSKKELEKAEISLNDCLACSGCITSAESILITQQSKEEFYENIGQKRNQRIVVISVSPQSRASLATYFEQNILKTHHQLITFFKSLGVDYVFDTSFSREFSLLESCVEFVTKYKEKSSTNLPILASSCPGWICYAEKTHGSYILPYISTVKSPQQVMGSIIKNYFASKLNVTGDKIYHVAVMPCWDKKLEASRDDFYNEILRTRDVDTVLTSAEILDMIIEKKIDFKALPESPMDKLFTNIDEAGLLQGTLGSSGGYLETIFRFAARELFGTSVNSIDYKVKRNSDLKEVTLEVNGEVVLSFALVYGFRNIQNLVRRVKQKNSTYHFVEVMACPSGCSNGGGQIRAKPNIDPKRWLVQVEEAYHQQAIRFPLSLEEAHPMVRKIYEEWLGGQIGSTISQKHLHTQYHEREKLVTALATQW